MITKEEAQEIKTDIALLKKSTSDTLSAIHDQAEAQKELLAGMNELTSEIREDRVRREVHDEKREIKDEYIQNQIRSNTERLDYFTKNYKQAVERLIISQGRKDKFINAIFSNAGKTVIGIIFIAALYFFGIDPKNIKG